MRSMSRSGGVPAQAHAGEHGVSVMGEDWAVCGRLDVVANVRIREARGRSLAERLSNMVRAGVEKYREDGHGDLFGFGIGSAMTCGDDAGY